MAKVKQIKRKVANAKKALPAAVSSEWKKVKLAGKLITNDGGAGLEGLLGVEVLENYNGSITRQKLPKQKRRKFVEASDSEHSDDEKEGKIKKKTKKTKKDHRKPEPNEANTPSIPGQFVLLKPPQNEAEEHSDEKDTEINDDLDELSAWNGFGIPEQIMRALAEKKFTEPTEIQRLTLPAAIHGRRDILGAAETGSGKTLAFGIPIVSGILNLKKSPENVPFRKVSSKMKSSNDVEEKQPQILKDPKKKARKRHQRDNWTPPPEECNLPSRDKTVSEGEESDDESELKPLYALILTPTRELAVQVTNHLLAITKYTDIRVTSVFGGLTAIKQERMLSKCPEIVVATPGRLWELLEDGNKHLNKLRDIKFLVVDETDRMFERGHFEELRKVLKILNDNETKCGQRQNFIFSATLTLTHENDNKKQGKKGNKHQKQPETIEGKLQSFIQQFGITQPKIVDITPSQLTGGVAHKLTECRITCEHKYKDLYLYYIIQRHHGRTIVFCNSIECVRRLSKLFTILECDPRPLHAKMEQRQRLKNLERFTENDSGLLIATDVAARGLDIPNVEHVVHYQVPRTKENYIHRSGRTARGNKEGISILLIEPAEIAKYERIYTLKGYNNLPAFPIVDGYMTAIRERLQLARDIDLLELKHRRESASTNWLKKSAKEMDILIDGDNDLSDKDFYDSDDSQHEIDLSNKKRELRQKKVALKKMLSKPIFPKGMSFKYPDINSQETGIHVAGKRAVDVMKTAIQEGKSKKKQRIIT